MECSCSRQYVYKQMALWGIPLRDQSSARIIAMERNKIVRENISQEGSGQFVTLKKIDINENFFSTWSPEMAYVLGVIYTDGNLLYGYLSPRQSQPVGMFSLSQKEPEILHKVLTLMNCNARIHFSKKRQYGDIVAGEIYTFRVVEEKVYNDLLSLGLTPNKSLTMKFPDMPEEHRRHFIRGCWDGDGSIYFDNQSKNLKAHFVSGSVEFIEDMLRELESAGLPKRSIHINKGSKSPSYYFRYTGSQVPILYHYLYDGVPETQYLERKYQRFKMSLETNSVF